jgi:tetratricopeptide (TPR) repeat protein
MPVIPILIMFASFSVWWFYKKIKNRQVLPLFISPAVLIVLLLTLNTKLENITGDQGGMNHFSLGKAYYQLGEVESAIKEWQTSLEYDPHLNLSRTFLADAYFNQGLLDSAMKEYNTALRSDTSNHDRCYLGLALIHHQKEDRDRAIEFYLRSIKISPLFDYAHLMLGRAYHEKGLSQKARVEWEKVLELNPDHQGATKLLELLEKR